MWKYNWLLSFSFLVLYRIETDLWYHRSKIKLEFQMWKVSSWNLNWNFISTKKEWKTIVFERKNNWQQFFEQLSPDIQQKAKKRIAFHIKMHLTDPDRSRFLLVSIGIHLIFTVSQSDAFVGGSWWCAFNFLNLKSKS